MSFESRNTVKPPCKLHQKQGYNGLVIAYPLERNPFDLLRTLARMIGTDVARSKSAIILGLEQRISNVPLALAKFPVLQELQEPEDTVDECHRKLIQFDRVRSTNRERDEAIHFELIKQRIYDRLHVLRAKLKAESKEKQQKPSWVTTDEPPSELPYWRLCLQTGDQSHDGYCSDNDCSEFHSNVDDFQISEWEDAKTVYLSGEWRGLALAAKTHWKSGDSYACSGSGVCMASRITRLLSFERVDA